MDSQMYEDAPESTGAAPKAEKSSGKEDYGMVATLPKSILAGKDFKPGDEIVLKIDSIHEDEVVVSYAQEKGKEESAEQPVTAPEAKGGDDDMASMMQ